MPPNLKNKRPLLPKSESNRLDRLTLFERKLRRQGYCQIAGVDEAGRGPLAGPVIAAACIIPPRIRFPYINDSKLVTPKRRAELLTQIKKKTVFGIGRVDHEEIDQINIFQATKKAMQLAIKALPLAPDYLLVDGLTLEYICPSEKLIGGDRRSQSIAAASILAKETRDAIMCEYDKLYPEYGYVNHKGYGTAQHKAALEKHGPSPIQRLSFVYA